MVKDGRLSLNVTNDALGGDPSPGQPKQLRLEYALDDKPEVIVAREGEYLEIPPRPPMSTKEQADNAIAVLKSDAPQKEKAEACRLLAHAGTPDAVPVLAGLLADETLSHMARYGLEPIPDPSVDEALRDALGKLKGRLLVGVVHSLGVRRDAKAIEPLAKLLRDADADVAGAAAGALGRIATAPAAQTLEQALADAGAAARPALTEGVLRCADALAAQGQKAEALALYDRVWASKAASFIRGAALRGTLRAKGAEGAALLAEQLRSDDGVIFAALLNLVQTDLPGAEVTQALVAELAKLTGDRKLLLMQALGHRGDATALPAVLAAAESGDKPVRLAAIRTLAELGKPVAAPVLAKIAEAADGDLAQAAQEALASLPGSEVDAAIQALLDSPEAPRRQLGIQLATRRRLLAVMPALVKAAGDAEPKTRLVALQAVRELAGEAQLPALLDLLVKAPGAEELEATRGALASVCRGAEHPDQCVEKIAGCLAAAPPAAKGALFRVLGSLGGQKALQAVRAAVSDPDEKVKSAAVRAMAEWRDAEAAKDLLELARTLPNDNDKLLCLRGCLRLAGNQELPADQRLAVCKQAAPLIARDEEKKQLLGTLGGIRLAESVVEILPYLDNAATRAEASVAALGIAEGLLQGRQAQANAPKLIAPLQKVAEAAATPELANRAKALLKRAQAAASRK
jgi:HEAT repeat protein